MTLSGVALEPSHAVAVEMSLTVADPAAFVADPGSAVAMQRAIAETAGSAVAPEDVEVRLSVAGRGLIGHPWGTGRRLQGAVNVDASISVANGAEAGDLSEAMAATLPVEMLAATEAALAGAGVVVAVLGVSPITAAPEIRSVPVSDTTSSPLQGPGQGDNAWPAQSLASRSCARSEPAMLYALLAWAAFCCSFSLVQQQESV